MQLNPVTNSLWTEKFRPNKLENYIGNETLKDTVQRYIDQDDIPHLLFYARAGTGKTTLGKIITNAIDCDVLYINASDENNVETIRTKIKSFVSSVGFKKWKVVFLDECLEQGTLVSVLRNGKEIKLPIEELDSANDLVKSYDIERNLIEWQPFELFSVGTKEIWEIVLENGEVVKCTETHKWFVKDGDAIKVVKTNQLHEYAHILSPA